MSNTDRFDSARLAKKYSTCVPGVKMPSGRICVASIVVRLPAQPVRLAGTVVNHAGATPHTMLVELTAPRVSLRKHIGFAIPSTV